MIGLGTRPEEQLEHRDRGAAGHRRWDSRPSDRRVVVRTAAPSASPGPAGASTGSGGPSTCDGGHAFGGLDVTAAVANVNTTIAAALRGVDAADQQAVDDHESLDDSFANLGGNAAVATSLAVADAAATAAGEPLWHHLDPLATTLPTPEIQIFGGGAHAHRRVDLQDFLVVPGGAGSFAEALDWVSEVHRAAGRWLDQRGRLAGVAEEGGWWPAFDRNEEALDALVAAIDDTGLRAGVDVGISLDIAATQLWHDGGYQLGRDDATFDAAGWAEVLVGWIGSYPIVSIEDAFAEHDDAGMAAFTARVGERIQVVGDDYLVTSAERVVRAATAGAVNAVLIKPNQAGTVSRAAASTPPRHGLTSIVSARSGETEDVAVAHLAVGGTPSA